MTGPEAEYRAHLEAGRFMIQRSRSTGRYVFYPRIAVPGTGETDLEWVPASGGGTVYAITVNRSREGAYNLALIDLDEGPRMMSRIEGGRNRADRHSRPRPRSSRRTARRSSCSIAEIER